MRHGVNRVRSARRVLLVTNMAAGAPSEVAEEYIRQSFEFA